MVNTSQSKLWYAISLAAQLGFLVVLPLVGFAILGAYVDEKFGTSPGALLLGLALAITVTVVEVYHLLAPLSGPDEPDGQDVAGKDDK